MTSDRIRQLVLERDCHTCQGENCKYSGKRLEIHHKIKRESMYWFLTGKDRDDLNNLITYCPKCHDYYEQFSTDGMETQPWKQYNELLEECNRLREKCQDLSNELGFERRKDKSIVYDRIESHNRIYLGHRMGINGKCHECDMEKLREENKRELEELKQLTDKLLIIFGLDDQKLVKCFRCKDRIHYSYAEFFYKGESGDWMVADIDIRKKFVSNPEIARRNLRLEHNSGYQCDKHIAFQYQVLEDDEYWYYHQDTITAAYERIETELSEQNS